MNSVYIFAFIGGAVATVNPCGFALLPAYLARRINADSGKDNIEAIVRAVGVGAVTTCGFLFIFGLTGAALSLGAYWLMKVLPWAGFAIGIVLILTGIVVLTGRKISIRLPVLGGQIVARSWAGDLLFGIGYGTASLSCTLPLFLSVTGTAFTGSLAVSSLTFASYAFGMGTILTALAIAAAIASRGLESWIKKAGIYVNRLSGGVLVLSGIYVTFYWGIPLLSPGIPTATGFFTNGEIISGSMRGWLGGSVGKNTLLGLALVIFVFLGWAIWSRYTRKSHVDDTA